MESLDLVTSNAEEARTWVTGLRYLMAGISDEDSLARRQRTHDQYPSHKTSHVPFLCFDWLRIYLSGELDGWMGEWVDEYINGWRERGKKRPVIDFD